VEEEELARRRAQWNPPPARFSRGFGWLFEREVTQAHEGCDFRFLHEDGSGRDEPAIP